jgi:acyl-coenzyme A thioesterase PaaI-like protein
MTIDPAAVAAGLLQAVPFARTIRATFTEVSADSDGVRVTAHLPDHESTHNHVGGPHAGAMFTLGETASGAVVLAAFADQLTTTVPLAVRAEISYLKLAMGPVRATATLGRPVADVLADLDQGIRPEFPVEIELSTLDGTVTGRMSVTWTLRRK